MRGSPLRAIALLVASLAACRSAGSSSAAVVLQDDGGAYVRLRNPPGRIVSLNPTTTELLFAIGAGSRLVGRSRACDYPPAAVGVPDLGDGFPPVIEAVVAARPDLVVLYHSAGNAPAAQRFRELDIQVIRLRTDRLADVARAARLLGRATGAAQAGDSVAAVFGAELGMERAAATRGETRDIPVLLLAWDQPIIALGAGSFASELVGLAGGRNVFEDISAPSAPVSLEAIAARDPAVVVLAGSEMPGLEHRPEWRTLRAIRERQVVRLDQSSSNRPSPRAPAAIRSLRARLASLTDPTPSGDSR